MPGDIKRLNTLWVNKQQVERFPFLKDFLKYPFDIKGSKRKERGTQTNNTEKILLSFASLMSLNLFWYLKNLGEEATREQAHRLIPPLTVYVSNAGEQQNASKNFDIF